MNLKLKRFTADCLSILPVRRRVRLAVNDAVFYYGMACDGLTQMGQSSHLIRLALHPSRGFFEVLAHEFVHLHVDENWLHVQHGPIFQNACKVMARELKARGWNLGPLYDLKLDKKEAKHRVRRKA